MADPHANPERTHEDAPAENPAEAPADKPIVEHPETDAEPSANPKPADDADDPAEIDPLASPNGMSVATDSGDDDGPPEEEVIEALKEVIDPELMVNIVDLGLVYEIEIDGRQTGIKMTLTSPACPAGPQIMQQAKMSLERHPEIDEALITLTMSPPWTPDRMSDDAKDQLGIF